MINSNLQLIVDYLQGHRSINVAQLVASKNIDNQSDFYGQQWRLPLIQVEQLSATGKSMNTLSTGKPLPGKMNDI